MAFTGILCLQIYYTYSSSCNLTPPISRVLIGRQLIFYPLTWPMCCNSPQKCTPVKYQARQKARFPIVTYATSIYLTVERAFTKNSRKAGTCLFERHFEGLLKLRDWSSTQVSFF